MKLLLTGATGFIGSHVARRIVTEKCEVYALIRPGSNTWRINDIIESLNVVSCDLFASQKLDEYLKQIRPDLCIHLAWYAEPRKYLNSLENLRFLCASLLFATHLANLGCRRFIGAGSCAEYAPAPGSLSESSPTLSRNLYGASKLGLYLTLEQLGNVTNMEFSWVRIFYLYGPFEDERRLVPSTVGLLLRKQEVMVRKSEQIGDFLHVEDVAAAVWAVAQSNLQGPVNIGSGRPIAVGDIATKIGDILDRPDLIKFGTCASGELDLTSVYANNARLMDNTTWIPRYSLEKGLRQTVDWWKGRFKQ
ncbi:MAG: NAD-dependent epimerase/dehydratase family protein [Planctomycetota bacterium]|jgi:nucleoside-diphosphate-sugar epimerase